MAISAKDLGRLIDIIYAAAMNPDHWSDFLRACRPHIRHGRVVLHAHDVEHGDNFAMRHVDYPEDCVDAYREHFAALNPFPAVGSVQQAPGRAYVQDELVPVDALRNTEYYEDFLRRWGLEASISANLHTDTQVRTSLSVQGPRQTFPDVVDDWVELIGLLAPHLERAAQIAKVTNNQVVREHAYEAALDTLRHGVFLTNLRARVLHCNRAARRELDRGDAMMRVHRGQLELLHRHNDRRLRRALHDLLSGAGVASGRFSAFPLCNQQGQPAYAVYVMPWTLPSDRQEWSQALFSVPEPLALIFLCRVGAAGITGAELLRELFGWTPAESRLALALANGDTVASFARRCHVSVNTARSQLQSVLRKSGLTRQSELIQQVVHALGIVADDG